MRWQVFANSRPNKLSINSINSAKFLPDILSLGAFIISVKISSIFARVFGVSRF
jgi:hypothetical protein